MATIELSDVCERSLNELFGSDGKDDFEYVEGIVKLVLFSNFPRRRKLAIARLSTAFYGTRVKVVTLEDNGCFYAYLKFDGADKYLFVGVYDKSCRLIEPTPSEIEIGQWPE